MEFAVPVAVFLALIAVSVSRRGGVRLRSEGIDTAVAVLWEAARAPWPWLGAFVAGIVAFAVGRLRDPYGWVDDLQSLALLVAVLGGFVLFALLPANHPGPHRAPSASFARVAAGALGVVALFLAALWALLVVWLSFRHEACGRPVEALRVVVQVVLAAPAVLMLVLVSLAGLNYARGSGRARLGSQALWVPALSLLLPWLWVVLLTYSC
jgi:hypothetical protein